MLLRIWKDVSQVGISSVNSSAIVSAKINQPLKWSTYLYTSCTVWPPAWLYENHNCLWWAHNIKWIYLYNLVRKCEIMLSPSGAFSKVCTAEWSIHVTSTSMRVCMHTHAKMTVCIYMCVNIYTQVYEQRVHKNTAYTQEPFHVLHSLWIKLSSGKSTTTEFPFPIFNNKKQNQTPTPQKKKKQTSRDRLLFDFHRYSHWCSTQVMLLAHTPAEYQKFNRL